jgi:hypothetical protein
MNLSRILVVVLNVFFACFGAGRVLVRDFGYLSAAESKMSAKKYSNLALHDLTDSSSLRRTPHRHNGHEK